MAGRNPKAQTVRNMVLAMAVIIPVAFVSYVFIPHDEGRASDAVPTVDYRVELDTARRAAPYPVAAPAGLDKDWRATSVSYRAGGTGGKEGSVWHLGFLDPDTEYVAVEQSDGPARAFIDGASQRAVKTDRTQRVGDATWRHYEGEKYNALVREERGVTTVVTGTASAERLAEMAAALKSKKG
ncbi:DUF4245 domain-containing protein [Streptomyces telluris]|uniref:DUF4245 domain-containing protein n=1 Tax=Streptomyces telluris TaxID=2720021 RepID=A0A9X2LFI0_9ACTN|nr:DUF4245 domain-containing protein [Streptomyces telluris]MCQ8770208.1 DUF4245 domain-containing protein [Streptomyces telluris]NJP81339.1 DUF4245 domain-containing protein [Streptomyces telluris]